MSLFISTAVVLLSMLLLHAAVAPLLHAVALWLYRGRPPARADRSRARAAFLLLAGSPVLVLALGVSGLGHFAEGGAWASLLAACTRFHEHCDLLLTGASESSVYAVLMSAAALWLGLAARGAIAPALTALRLPTATLPPDLESKLLSATRLAELRHLPKVVTVRGLALTAGFLRSKVLLSIDLLKNLTEPELVAVLRHENAHIRRRDSLRTLAIRFAGALAPRTSPARRAELAYDLDREILCDAEAVRRGADPLALAAALVRVARGRTMALALPNAVGSHDVDRSVSTRVHLLISDGRPEPLDITARTVVAGAAVTALAMALPHVAFGVVTSVHCGVETLVHLLS